MPISPQTYTKSDVQKGNEADLPPRPLAGDIFITTDTGKLCICFENGAWIEQPLPIPTPLGIDENGVLTFNGKAIYSTGSIGTVSFATASRTLTTAGAFFELNGHVNYSHVLSTAATPAELRPENILSATTGNGGSVKILSNSLRFFEAGTVLYCYYWIRDQTLEQIFENLDKFRAVSTTQQVGFRHMTNAAAVRVSE